MGVDFLRLCDNCPMSVWVDLRYLPILLIKIHCFGIIFNTMRIILDTNVLVAGLRSRRGSSFELIKLIGTNQFEIVSSTAIFFEYESVLHREGLFVGFNHSQIDDFLDYLASVIEWQKIYFLWRPKLKDPKDDMVLEVAVNASVDYIVTWNIKDFKNRNPFQLEVITPQEFLTQLRKSNEYN